MSICVSIKVPRYICVEITNSALLVYNANIRLKWVSDLKVFITILFKVSWRPVVCSVFMSTRYVAMGAEMGIFIPV